MRVLIVTTDYPAFLAEFYAAGADLAHASYDEQMRRRNDTLFANADFYSRGLAAHGATAADIYMNNEILQRRWAQENGVRLAARPRSLRSIAERTPLRHFLPSGPTMPDWVVPILAAQIEAFRPDVIVNADVHYLAPAMLRAIAGTARLMVAQTNTFLVPQLDYGAYDLVLSAFPAYVRDFNRKGIRARLSRLAFDPAVLAHVHAAPRTIPIAFVGSFGSLHAERRALLEYLCERVDVAVWGPNAEELPVGSPIRRRHRGRAWGREMFQIFTESEIVLNHEHAISSPYAANMRFYEATGCGALLLTNRRDLSGMFEPEKELALYDDAEDCVRRIEELRGDTVRCRAIAQAGEQRTLHEHTYAARASEMIGFFDELREPARPARSTAMSL